MNPRHKLRPLLLTITSVFTSILCADEIGLKVGERAPEFLLMNQDGKEVSLASLLAENDKVALAFFRSADWCPFCKRQLMDLQDHFNVIEAAGIKLVGISNDPVDVLHRFSKKESIAYLLLSDPGSKTIDAYKIRNEEAKSERTKGIPHPTIFLLNKEGVIAAKLGKESYRERPSVEEILAAAKAMDS